MKWNEDPQKSMKMPSNESSRKIAVSTIYREKTYFPTKVLDGFVEITTSGMTISLWGFILGDRGFWSSLLEEIMYSGTLLKRNQ